MSTMAPFLDAMGRASEMKANAAMANNALASRERTSFTDNAFGLINTAMLNKGAMDRQGLANQGALDRQKLENEGRLAEIEATKNMHLAVNKAMWHMNQETKFVDAYMQLADDFSVGPASEAAATMNQIITFPALVGQVQADKMVLANTTSAFSMAKTDKELAEQTQAIRNTLNTRYNTLSNYSKMAALQAEALAPKILAAAGANPTEQGIIAATRQVLLDPQGHTFAGMQRGPLFMSYLDGVLPNVDGSPSNPAKSAQLTMDLQNGIGVDGATYVTELLKRTMMKVGEGASANAVDAARAKDEVPTAAAMNVGKQVVGRVLAPALGLSMINGNDVEITKNALTKMDSFLTEGPGGSAINVPAMRDQGFYGALSTISGGNADLMNQWLNTNDPKTPGARGISARIGDSASKYASTQPANFEDLASRGQAASKGRAMVGQAEDAARMGRDILQQATAKQVTNYTNAARINFAVKARMLQRTMTALNSETGMQDPQLPADLEKLAQEGYEAASRIGADTPAAKTWRDIDTQVRAEWQKAQLARNPQPQATVTQQPATPQPAAPQSAQIPQQTRDMVRSNYTDLRPQQPTSPSQPVPVAQPTPQTGGVPPLMSGMSKFGRGAADVAESALRGIGEKAGNAFGGAASIVGYPFAGRPSEMSTMGTKAFGRGDQPAQPARPQQSSMAPPINIAAPLPGGGPIDQNARAAMMIANQAAQRQSHIRIDIKPIQPKVT